MNGRELNREILRLSVPSILANITVPIVGMVDTAVAGHLPGGDAAAAIGAVSLGSTLFTFIYWCFGFLRTGTGGLTAQAFGRGDMRDSARIFMRGIAIAAIVSVLILSVQLPFIRLAMSVTNGSADVESLASRYFLTRVWAAPATMALMVFRGWFVGMQDSISSMWTDLVVNIVNIAASIILALGIGGWSGLGFDGIALGTVTAQYCGLAYCILTAVFKYRRKVFSTFCLSDFGEILRWRQMKGFLAMNLDLFGRSLFFTSIYLGYTMFAAGLGDLQLAVSSIMMQLLMLFSFFTDGFAYAGEALTGRFIGEKDAAMLHFSVRYIFYWTFGVAAAFVGIYIACGVPLCRLMTDDYAVVEACRAYLPWLILMPPLGCAAFTWDGIYMGATASKGLLVGMLLAAAGFYVVWLAGNAILQPDDSTALHILLAAYFTHLLARTSYLTARYRAEIRV